MLQWRAPCISSSKPTSTKLKFSKMSSILCAHKIHYYPPRAIYSSTLCSHVGFRCFQLISSRARLTVLYVLASSAELISGIIPHATSYISWFVMIFGPLSYILRVRRDILPIADSLSKTTTGFNSSTASGLSSHQRSTSNGSSDNAS